MRFAQITRLASAPIVAILIVAITPAQAADFELDASKLTAIDGIVETEIGAGHIPGAVVLIGQGERILYSHAFGRREVLPESEPMTLDTIFDLASLTKVVATTPAILQLVQRGSLSLDAPVARYWPAFAANGKEGITVRELLTHRSGLPAGIDMRSDMTAGDVWRKIEQIKPVSLPGGEPIYSDINFAVLGELVRRVSGQSLNVYGARHVFGPLSMRDTGFLPPQSNRLRIAPTTWDGKQLRRGTVHDPLAAHLGGVAGNAGLFATASDLACYARALLAGGSPILEEDTVEQMFAPQTLPSMQSRGLGWRLEAPLAANRAALPPMGMASHLGYTGTGVWMDKLSGVYVIILSNRVHPDGRGDAAPLRARVIAAIADAMRHVEPEEVAALQPEFAARITPYIVKKVAQPVSTGIDVLEAQDFAPLHGLRIGLLTNRSGVDRAGRRTIDILRQTSSVTLVSLFSPEHGLGANHEGRVGDDTDSLSGLPVYSLYGSARRPTAPMLDGLDAIVVDLQDAGARFYTYMSTLAYVMEAASDHELQIFVLDRPNPVNGMSVQGPMLDANRSSFTGYWPLPVRHGLTLGEFALLYKSEAKLAVKLTVIPMQNYRRARWYDETGLPWLPPSPNLISPNATMLYPGVGMIEGAEVSVGRGTMTPFEVVGAPWIESKSLITELERMALPGLEFRPISFTPQSDRYAGQHCEGTRIVVTDRSAVNMPALGLALAITLYRLYPQNFSLDKTAGSIGSQATLDAIIAGKSFDDIVASWNNSLTKFQERRTAYLLYH